MKTDKIKGAVFTVISILAFLFLFISASPERSEKPRREAQTADSYTVAEYDGKIAVFKNGEVVPFEIYDSYVETLPEHDREILRKGIKTKSAAELQKIIEDYTS